MARLKRWSVAVKTLGPHEVVAFLLRRSLETLHLTRGPYEMKPSFADYPVWGRSRTSDLDVFAQIFLHREYRCLDALTDIDTVIDCGANVGYSSAYFLSRFPNSTVVAVEPDSGNFAALQKNLEPYGNRVRAVHSGVWPESVGLVMNEAKFRDGREWARQVRPARAGEAAAMDAVDIPSLIELCGKERISILKIDIEGAEFELFSSPAWRDWMDRIDTVVIEVHGVDAYQVTMAAFKESGFETDSCDELIVAQRPNLGSADPASAA